MDKKEFVDRGALIRELHECGIFPVIVRRTIERAPAADVVEVVRCKDCKHSRPVNKLKPLEKYFKDECIVCDCEDVVGDEPMIYVPCHYCSYGERNEK